MKFHLLRTQKSERKKLNNILLDVISATLIKLKYGGTIEKEIILKCDTLIEGENGNGKNRFSAAVLFIVLQRKKSFTRAREINELN